MMGSAHLVPSVTLSSHKKKWIFLTTPSFAENAAKIPKRAIFLTFSEKFVLTSNIFFRCSFRVKIRFLMSQVKK